MSPLLVLTGLLVLAYFGSILFGGRTIRGFGLPSGTEWLLIGIFLGPAVLGVVDRQGLARLESITLFALAWLAFVTGAGYGSVEGRVVGRRRLGLGMLLALGPMTLAGAAAALAALVTTNLSGRELVLVAMGIGCVSGETTRHAVRWVATRYKVQGPLSELIDDVAEADDAPPLLMLGALFVLAPQQDALNLDWPRWSLVLATLGIGSVMGATCAALFDVERRPSQRWGIVLGTALLATGASMRLGLAAVAATFAMGIVAAALSRDRASLRDMLDRTERAVMLPVLVLAGAYVSLRVLQPFALVAAASVLARVVGKLAMGRVLVIVAAPRARVAGAGLGLLPAGVLTLTAGLACALRFPGQIGDAILAIAALNTVLGELVGPAMLRRTLRLAGEVGDAESTGGPVFARPAPTGPRRHVRPGRGSIRSSSGADGAEDIRGTFTENIRTTTGHRPRSVPRENLRTTVGRRPEPGTRESGGRVSTPPKEER